MANHESNKERSWSDLPCDILELIESRLFGSDHYSFHAVCKTWRSIPSSQEKILRENKDLPTLVSFKLDRSTTDFFNPILFSTPKTANSIYRKLVAELTNSTINEEITGEKEDRYSPAQMSSFDFEFYDSGDTSQIIRAAKHGWLLLSQGKRRLFFLNPMTQQKIDLPDLPSSYSFDGLSFSTTPTSPDCLVLGFYSSDPIFIGVSFIYHGQDSWTKHTISVDQQFMSSYTSPVFHDGCFYFISSTGNLGVYNLEKRGEEEAWYVLDRPQKPRPSIRSCYLIERNGELMSVFLGSMGQWVRAYLLDPSSRNWVKKERLGDTTLFVGRIGSLATKTTNFQVPGLENKIFFAGYDSKDGSGIFYNLESGKFHTFWPHHTKENLYDTQCIGNCAWIEPDHHVYTDEELKWLPHEA